MKSVSLVLLVFMTAVLPTSGFSEILSAKQRGELFIYGRITDSNGTVWNIKIIPGSEKSRKIAIEGWTDAQDKAGELFRVETYKNEIPDVFNDGVELSKEGLELAKRAVVVDLTQEALGDFYNGTSRDMSHAVNNVGNLITKRPFGWPGGVIWYGFIQPGGSVLFYRTPVMFAQSLWALGKSLFGLGQAAVGGIVSAGAAPGVMLSKPVLALAYATTEGILVPGSLLVWNGMAWTSAQVNNVPEEEFYLGGIPFVVKESENP